MSLLDLPEESLLRISQFVAPFDLESWTLTCQSTKAVTSQSRLKGHKQMLKDCGNYTLDGEHPAKLLHEIWSDPWIAYYIRDLTYVNDDRWAGNDRAYDHVSQDTRHQLRTCSFVLLEESPFFKQRFQDSPVDYDEYLKGDETPAFALVLTLLPRLRRLQLRRCQWDANQLVGLLQPSRAAGVPQQSKLLSKLNSVNVERERDDGPTNINNFAMWARFPSVKELYGRSIVGTKRQYPLEPEICGDSKIDSIISRSSLRSVHIVQSILDAKTLEAFLKMAPILENLKFSHESGPFADPQNYEFRPKHAQIAATVSHKSLRSLVLSGEPDAVVRHLDLRGFEVLEHLEIPVDYFVIRSPEGRGPVEDASTHALVDVLPSSLISLTLSNFTVSDDQVQALFSSWMQRKTTQLPYLRTLRLGFGLADIVQPLVGGSVKLNP